MPSKPKESKKIDIDFISMGLLIQQTLSRYSSTVIPKNLRIAAYEEAPNSIKIVVKHNIINNIKIRSLTVFSWFDAS